MAKKSFTKLGAVCIAAGLVSMGLAGSGTTASARDNGLQEFFSHQFGIGASQPEGDGQIWSEEDPYERPLVVRPHHRPRAPRVAAIAKGPTQVVSIYEDPTLRRGDAVMTAKGMRIFKGSASIPYRDADFVAISDSSVSRDVAKTLLAMDRVPRS